MTPRAFLSPRKRKRGKKEKEGDMIFLQNRDQKKEKKGDFHFSHHDWEKRRGKEIAGTLPKFRPLFPWKKKKEGYTPLQKESQKKGEKSRRGFFIRLLKTEKKGMVTSSRGGTKKEKKELVPLALFRLGEKEKRGEKSNTLDRERERLKEGGEKGGFNPQLFFDQKEKKVFLF